MQPAAFDEILARAAARRAAIADIASGATNAFRLLDGTGDGVPGVYIDSYAGHWLVQTRDVPIPDRLRCPGIGGSAAVWWKELTTSARDAPQWISGSPATGILALEHGLRFTIDFAAGYSQGIFLDQRENRRWLREHCDEEESVLNLFAYTCAFAVAAAAAGAATTSVDLSGNYLDWGRRNFAENGIACGAGSGHRFYQWDAFEFLRRAARQSERHTLIVCDPPTFSRNRQGKVFRVQQDLAVLAEHCARVLAPGGRMLISANHRGLARDRFAEMVRSGVSHAGRILQALEFCEMPADFSEEAYLKCCRVRLD